MKRFNLLSLAAVLILACDSPESENKKEMEETEEKQGEDDTLLLCNAYTEWCTESWPFGPSLHCNPGLPCHQIGLKVLNCMHTHGICWPLTSHLCSDEGDTFDACMDEHPVCGDGYASGDEECDNGNMPELFPADYLCTPECKVPAVP